MEQAETKKRPSAARRIWTEFRARYGALVSPFLFTFVLFGLDFLFRWVYNGVGVTSVWDLIPNTFSLCWSILLTVAALLLPGWGRQVWMGLTLGFFAFLPLAHAVIYNVTGSFLTFSDLAFAGDGMSFMSAAYLNIPWKMYVFTVLLVAVGVLAILLAPKKQGYKPVKLLLVAVLTVASIFTIAVEDNGYTMATTGDDFDWLDYYDPTDPKAIYTDFIDPNQCLPFCGNYQYVARSVTKYLYTVFHRNQLLDSLSEYYNDHQKERNANEMTGLFEGKNVICILGESIDTWMVNDQIMPNLYSLQQQSIDFTDHYTPLFLSAGTFNTEFALNCGYYLPVNGTTARTYATNKYPQSLANVFRGNGYTANSYHQLDGHYYNRKVVHLVWGYESYNDKNVLGFQGHNNLDTSLMEQVSYSKIVHDEPFVSYIITYSGHGPYTSATAHIAASHMERAEEVAPLTGAETDNENTWSEYVYAIAHAMETDEMIGMLIDNMKRDGHIDDTVILFFGDHYCKYLTDVGFVMSLKGAWDGNSLDRTPFFIYSSDLEERLAERGLEDRLEGHKVAVTKPTASADMLPTLLNLMGFENYDPTYYAGSDAFSEYGGIVGFKDYSWYDGEVWWTPDYEGVETDDIKEKCRLVREWINVSWNTINTNYFAYVSIPGIAKE